jgi:hypothetical protein
MNHPCNDGAPAESAEGRNGFPTSSHLLVAYAEDLADVEPETEDEGPIGEPDIGDERETVEHPVDLPPVAGQSSAPFLVLMFAGYALGAAAAVLLAQGVGAW